MGCRGSGVRSQGSGFGRQAPLTTHHSLLLLLFPPLGDVLLQPGELGHDGADDRVGRGAKRLAVRGRGDERFVFALEFALLRPRLNQLAEKLSKPEYDPHGGGAN